MLDAMGRSNLTAFVSLIICVLIENAFCQRHVCLQYNITDTHIIIQCSVDKLGFDIVFHFPEETIVGYCLAPVKSGENKYSEKCKLHEGLTQNQQTNVTTLIVERSASYYGIWTCAHGSSRQSLNVRPFDKFVEGTRYDVYKYIVIVESLVIPILLMLLIALNCFPRQKRSKGKQRPDH